MLPRAPGWIATALHLPHTGFVLPQQADISPVPRLRTRSASLPWALLVLAAARPQWLGPPEDVPRSGRDLLLAIDTSGSMSIEDMQLGGAPAPRFAAIQAIATDFVRRRSGDRVGLILFGTRAYLLVPLTFDLKTVASSSPTRRSVLPAARPRSAMRSGSRSNACATVRRISACWFC